MCNYIVHRVGFVYVFLVFLWEIKNIFQNKKNHFYFSWINVKCRVKLYINRGGGGYNESCITRKEERRNIIKQSSENGSHRIASLI